MMGFKKRGFTLIELLVVIAIIAILAAILFPMFTRAKKAAQDSTCINNLKQIGTAMNLYCSDNGDRYPTVAACGVNSGSANSVAGLIPLFFQFSYCKNTNIWTCPVGAARPDTTGSLCTNPRGGSSALVGWVSMGNRRVSSNYFSFPLNIGIPAAGAQPYAEFCRGWTPAEAITKWGRTFSPGGAKYDEGYRQEKWNNRLIQDGYTVGSNPWRPHRGGTTILFHDGHVARIADYRAGNDG